MANELPNADGVLRGWSRATPTVDGDRVYVVGATGRLFCLDVETGDVIWGKDYVADYGTSVPTWGIASVPARRP